MDTLSNEIKYTKWHFVKYKEISILWQQNDQSLRETDRIVVTKMIFLWHKKNILWYLIYLGGLSTGFNIFADSEASWLSATFATGIIKNENGIAEKFAI